MFALLKLAMGGGAIGIDLKMLHLVMAYPESFPFIPNIFDVVLVVGVGYTWSKRT